MWGTASGNRDFGADKFGFKGLTAIHWNLSSEPLYEHAIRNGEASVVASGALCAETGVHTGRSPKDKHTVVDALTENTVWWDGNRRLSQANFGLLTQISSPTPAERSCTPRISTPAPIPNTRSKRGCSLNSPGIRCLSTSY